GAKLKSPSGIALDSAGNLYIADSGNHRIRKVDAATGIITTVAGNGQLGFSGDDGPAIQANFYLPTGVAVDAGGNIYIVDFGNKRIRRVSAASGRLTTIAGTGVLGFNGDNTPAKDASLGLLFVPALISIDPMGNVIFADRNNQRIRKISMSDGKISTIAGTGIEGFGGDGGDATKATLQNPVAAIVDAGGNLYVSDTGNNR